MSAFDITFGLCIHIILLTYAHVINQKLVEFYTFYRITKSNKFQYRSVSLCSSMEKVRTFWYIVQYCVYCVVNYTGLFSRVRTVCGIEHIDPRWYAIQICHYFCLVCKHNESSCQTGIRLLDNYNFCTNGIYWIERHFQWCLCYFSYRLFKFC